MNVIYLCILLGNPYSDSLANALKFKGVNVKIEENNFSYVFIFKVLAFKNVKVLHLHTLHYFFLGKNLFFRWVKFFVFILQILLLKLLGIKIVWTVHEWTDRFAGGRNRILSLWSVMLGKIFDAVITHCETTKSDIVKAFGPSSKNQVYVVPHGNYIGTYKNNITQEDARKKLRIPENDIVFLLFGGIHRTKGFLEAIDSFKELNMKNTSLLVVGLPAEEGIEMEIQNKIAFHSNINFVPRKISDDEIHIYMNACDCVVIPYKVSTTSGVTILSMSCGKPCIAPKTGFFSDVLDKEGSFLYDPNDRNGLSFAMKIAASSANELGKMGSYNLSVAKQWSWEKIAEETASVYKRVGA